MRDLKYDIARSFAMIWIVGIYHMSEYVSLPLHTQQWARIVTWSCLGVFTFISAYFLSGKNTFFNFSDIFLFYKKRLLRFYPLFFVAAITMLLIDFNDWDQTWRGLRRLIILCSSNQYAMVYIYAHRFLSDYPPPCPMWKITI